MNTEIDGTVEITTAGTYKYSSDYFLYGSTLSVSGTGDVLLYLYGCNGEINLYSTKTSGYLKVYVYGFKGLFGINCADNSHVPRIYIYGGEMLISNGGKIQVLQVEAAISRLVSGGTIDNYINNSKMAASIAAGDIATDAITAASVKADAVTKIQANLALGTNLETVRLGVVDVKAYLVSPVQEFLTNILSAVGESDYERSVMNIVEELLFKFHSTVFEAQSISADGTYNYFSTYFESTGSIDLAVDSTGEVALNLYKCNGNLTINSAKTSGTVRITLYNFTGKLTTNLGAGSTNIIICYSSSGQIYNPGTLYSITQYTSFMHIEGAGVITAGIVKLGKIDAALAVGSIATNAIEAITIKADAVTKIQAGLSKPETAQTIIPPADMALESTAAKLVVRRGTAQGGDTGYIQLDSGASSDTDFYKDLLVVITGGTGIGQVRQITGYNGGTKRAAVGLKAFLIAPDVTSTFDIVANAVPEDMASQSTLTSVQGAVGDVDARTIVIKNNLDSTITMIDSLGASVNADHDILLTFKELFGEIAAGIAVSGGASTIQLPEYTPNIPLVGAILILTGGTGSGQGRLITEYSNITKIATVSVPFTVVPDDTTSYRIHTGVYQAGLAQEATLESDLDVNVVSVAGEAVAGLDDVSKVWDVVLAELTGDPGASPAVKEAVMLAYMALRNKETASAAVGRTIANNAGDTILTSTISDNGSLMTKNKLS